MNVLFVSIAFPPKKDAECIQTARYFKFFTRFDDLNIEVVTSAIPTLFMPVDSTLDKYDTGWKNKIEIEVPENKYFNFIKRKLGFAFLPDSKALFHKSWKSAIHKLKEKPDVVYSRSYPLSSTIAAFHYAEHFDIPWILHLSDPWVDSPLHAFTNKEISYHSYWEKKSFFRASRICLTSEKAIEFYQRKYPELEDRFEWCPNVFNAEEIQEEPIDFASRCRVVYAGGFAGTRSPSSLLEALSIFNQENPNSEKLELIFAGPADRKMLSIIQSCTETNFRYLGPMSLEKSLELQKMAHCLTIVDSPIKSEELAMFFPSKILEYFMANRKIMAVTSRNSATEKVMISQGLDSFTFDDINGIASFFSKLVEEFELKNEENFKLNKIPEEYSAEINANKLRQLLKSI